MVHALPLQVREVDRYAHAPFSLLIPQPYETDVSQSYVRKSCISSTHKHLFDSIVTASWRNCWFHVVLTSSMHTLKYLKHKTGKEVEISWLRPCYLRYFSCAGSMSPSKATIMIGQWMLADGIVFSTYEISEDPQREVSSPKKRIHQSVCALLIGQFIPSMSWKATDNMIRYFNDGILRTHLALFRSSNFVFKLPQASNDVLDRPIQGLNNNAVILMNRTSQWPHLRALRQSNPWSMYKLS